MGEGTRRTQELVGECAVDAASGHDVASVLRSS